MTRLERLLSQYAAYHLDRKNVTTHFIGIPLIVFSVMCLTARASVFLSGYELTLALVVLTVSILYYLTIDVFFALLMSFIFMFAYPYAYGIAQWETNLWLSSSVFIFILGWAFQFVGHVYEKKKPAFMDDLIGLAIGPLFVLAELVFLLGFRKELEEKVLLEARRQRLLMEQSETFSEMISK